MTAMMNDWTDRMTFSDALNHWDDQRAKEIERRLERIESELKPLISSDQVPVDGFYEAMQSFIKLREKLFPNFPADPAWKILVVLANTAPGDPRSSITGIMNGAEIPQTTALRYLSAMELSGIIERVKHPTDGRQTLIRLTDLGRNRLATIAEKWASRMMAAIFMPIAGLLLYSII